MEIGIEKGFWNDVNCCECRASSDFFLPCGQNGTHHQSAYLRCADNAHAFFIVEFD